MNTTTQRRILQGVKVAGDTDVYFYVSILQNGKRYPAFVAGYVPTIPTHPDPEAAQQYAHLLLETARMVTPKAVLATELTTAELLDAAVPGAWREWQPLDVVCPFCAGINCDADCLPPGYSFVTEVDA